MPSRIAFTEHTRSADVTVSLDRAQVPTFGGTGWAAARAFGNLEVRPDDDDGDRLAGDRPETTSCLAAMAAARLEQSSGCVERQSIDGPVSFSGHAERPPGVARSTCLPG
jgi:hypothetical protein